MPGGADTVVVNEDAVGSDVHLFILHKLKRWMCDGALKAACKAAGLTGLQFDKVTTK